eukprot:1992271-Prymnesium_polylepis.1
MCGAVVRVHRHDRPAARRARAHDGCGRINRHHRRAAHHLAAVVAGRAAVLEARGLRRCRRRHQLQRALLRPLRRADALPLWALLALVPLAPVLADPLAAALLAPVALPPVLADANATAILAHAAPPAVLADSCALALLAAGTLSLVDADAAAAA